MSNFLSQLLNTYYRKSDIKPIKKKKIKKKDKEILKMLRK